MHISAIQKETELGHTVLLLHGYNQCKNVSYNVNNVNKISIRCSQSHPYEVFKHHGVIYEFLSKKYFIKLLSYPKDYDGFGK